MKMSKGTRPCRDCNGLAGVSALTCPHCGAPSPALPDPPATTADFDAGEIEAYEANLPSTESGGGCWSCGCSIFVLTFVVALLWSWCSGP